MLFLIRTACNFNSYDTEQYLLLLVSSLNATVLWKHLDQTALREATFRCLRGSQSVMNSKSSPSCTAARTTTAGLQLSRALVATATGAHLLRADIYIAATNGWIRWTSESFKLIKHHLALPLSSSYSLPAPLPASCAHPSPPHVYVHSIKADTSL